MVIGFTGTRKGMSNSQWHTVREFLLDGEIEYVVHGMCVGADRDFHFCVRELRPECKIVGLPCNIKALVADVKCDITHPPQPPLVRNRVIVAKSDVLIACPEGSEVLRSGTWATVRYARQAGIKIVIF